MSALGRIGLASQILERARRRHHRRSSRRSRSRIRDRVRRPRTGDRTGRRTTTAAFDVAESGIVELGVVDFVLGRGGDLARGLLFDRGFDLGALCVQM